MTIFPVSPIVNMNGTSQEVLLEQVMAAKEAVAIAMKALAEATPHGRDYQTAPAGAYAVARGQHNARMNKLSDVYEDLETIALDVYKQRRSKKNWELLASKPV